MFHFAVLVLVRTAAAASVRTDPTLRQLPLALSKSPSGQTKLSEYRERFLNLTTGFADLADAIQRDTIRNFLCDVPPFAYAVFNHRSFDTFFKLYQKLNGHATKEAAIENLWKFRRIELEPVVDNLALSKVFRTAIASNKSLPLSDPYLGDLRRICKAYLGVLEEVDARIRNSLFGFLDLSDTGIVDLSRVAGFIRLNRQIDPSKSPQLPENLPPSDMTRSDLSPPSGLVELSDRPVLGTLLTELSVLAGLSQVLSASTDTQFEGLPSNELSPSWSGRVGVQSLSLKRTPVQDLSPLSGLQGLTTLSLGQTKVTDLTPLSTIVGLRWLDLKGTPVHDLSQLSGIHDLTHLNLDGTHVSNLSPLSTLVNLTWLSLNRTPVHNLNPLSGLLRLRWLFLSGTHVSKLSPLSTLSGLICLQLKRTFVDDLSPLSGLHLLEELDLAGNPITNLSPLFGLRELRKLRLDGIHADRTGLTQPMLSITG